MCRLRNITMRDYRKCDFWTNRHPDRHRTKWSLYVPLCFAGDTKIRSTFYEFLLSLHFRNNTTAMSASPVDVTYGGRIKGFVDTEFSVSMVWIIGSPILIVIGTISNTLGVIVLTRKRMRRNPTMFYLTILSVGDIFVLFGGLGRIWSTITFGRDFRDNSDYICKLQVFFTYFQLQFTSWILVAVSIDRCVSVCWPLKGKQISTMHNARVTVLIIFLTLVAVNCPLFWGVSIQILNNNRKCSMTPNFDWYVWSWVDMCIFCIVPFIIMIICNLLISKQIIKAQKSLRKYHMTRSAQNKETTTISQESSNSTTNVQTVAKRTSRQVNRENSNSQRSKQLSGKTRMLLVLSWTYLALTTPIGVFLIKSDYLNENKRIDFQWAIVNMLQYTNNAIHFFLYCLTGSKFRDELKSMFCCKRWVFPDITTLQDVCYVCCFHIAQPGETSVNAI